MRTHVHHSRLWSCSLSPFEWLLVVGCRRSGVWCHGLRLLVGDELEVAVCHTLDLINAKHQPVQPRNVGADVARPAACLGGPHHGVVAGCCRAVARAPRREREKGAGHMHNEAQALGLLVCVSADSCTAQAPVLGALSYSQQCAKRMLCLRVVDVLMCCLP